MQYSNFTSNNLVIATVLANTITLLMVPLDQLFSYNLILLAALIIASQIAKSEVSPYSIH